MKPGLLLLSVCSALRLTNPMQVENDSMDDDLVASLHVNPGTDSAEMANEESKGIFSQSMSEYAKTLSSEEMVQHLTAKQLAQD